MELRDMEWTVAESPDAGGNLTIRWDDGSPEGDAEPDAVATVHDDDARGAGDVWDRANIMAAAPKLLAALAVLTRAPHIRELIAGADRKALYQAEDAVHAAMVPHLLGRIN